MGMLDTLSHGETALLANVAEEIVLHETEIEDDASEAKKRHIVFDPPRIVEYRASVDDLSTYFVALMTDASLRDNMGHALRTHVVKHLDYRVVARRFVEIIVDKLGIK
jgi:hypothetical protein